MAEETIPLAGRTCEHRQPNEGPCGAEAPYLVSVGSRRHDAQASCERHLEATVSALEGAEDRAAVIVIAAPAPALIALAEAADARDRFREQARLLGEGKAEWLCEACEVIHPWRDGDRFTAACPDCGWPMVPTSTSLRALADARGRAKAAETKLAGIRAALAARKVTLTRPGWGFKQASNTDMVPWEAVAEVLGDGGAAAADAEALADVRKLGKTWAALPPETAAALTLRHAGAQLLAITGESEPER